MVRITSRVKRSDRARYNEYMRRYYAIPGNAEKHKRLMAEYGSRPEVKARRARLSRERTAGKAGRQTIAERTRTCARCGASFRRNTRGRVRTYCHRCVATRAQTTVSPGKGRWAGAKRRARPRKA
ncbi:MAG: hypothetical protein OXU37_00100 [Thaumarchaeota archaeon]|nr:hypothetical protein [Nitrososphaerota archaeon]RNJ76917.1 MAG: hypothetical protein EB824_00015 [Thaumarchaeota archaeon S15]